MNKKKRNGKIWQVLSVVLLTLLFSTKILFALSEHTPKEQTVAKDQAILNAIADAHTMPIEQAAFQDQALLQDQVDEREGIDPTKPASFLFDPLLDNGMVDNNEDKAARGLALTAIFIAKDRKIAVINGILLKEGEAIGSKKVTEITVNTVRLVENKEIVELRLPSFSIKKEAS